MERIDIYNSNRVKTNKIIDRKEKLNDGEYKLSCHMWIINSNNEIYIQQRALTRDFAPGLWENAGGGVLSGENTFQACKREFKEELGIEIKKTPKLFKTIRRKHDFVDLYLIKQDFDIDDLMLQEDEVNDAMWVTIEEIETMINKGLMVKSFNDSYEPFLEYYNNVLLKQFSVYNIPVSTI